MNKVLIVSFILLGWGCNKKPTFSVVPKITYKSMQPQIVAAGASIGGTRISIYFEDGDGDIGFGTENLFFKDSRDSSEVQLMIPEIPAEYFPGKGMKGTITVDYLSALLALRPDTNHISTDTLRWQIYMKDKAGNVSNTIETEDLFLFK